MVTGILCGGVDPNDNQKQVLVGGFNPFKNMLVKLDHLPRLKTKNYLSCHHLVIPKLFNPPIKNP